MSDVQPEIEVPAAEEVADTPIESGAPAESEAPSGPVLDPSAYADHYVPVKVAGEEQLVPMSEALAGYSRQADYTRKTQALAEREANLNRAQAIATALAEDPAETIRVLAEVYDVSFEQAAAIAADASAESEAAADPYQQRLDQIEQRLRQEDEQRALAQLQSDLDTAVERYGVDGDAVVQRAIELGTNDLDFVARGIAYDAAQSQAAVDAQREQRVGDKRAAAVIHGGGTNPSTSSAPAVINSFEDAARAAAAQHGVSLSL